MNSVIILFLLPCLIFGQLISPIDNDSLNTVHVLFEWEQLSNAASYQIQIAESDSTDFQNTTADLIDSTLLIIIDEGFLWGTTYVWRIRSVNSMGNFGEWSETGTFRIKPLPEEIASLDIAIYDSLSYEDGITVMDQLGEGIIYAIDIHGNPVWFVHSNIVWSNGFSYLMQFTHFLPNGNFIGIAEGRENNLPSRAFEMGIDNTLIWEGPGNLELFGVHHDVFPIPNGNVLAITIQDTLLPIPDEIDVPEEYSYIDSISWQGDRIVEWDRNGDEVWSWSVFDHFDMQDFVPESYESMFTPPNNPTDFFYEWTHSNAVWYDIVDNVIYLSVRNLSRITKIDYLTGNVVWNMGKSMPSGDVTVGNDLGLSGQHSVKVLGNRNIMVYDNGFESDSLASRGLEISVINSDSIPEAEVIWDYSLPDGLGSPLMSDCDRLSNGNSLLTSTVANYIVEVSPDNEIVWEVLPNQDGSTYRSERIPTLYRQVFTVIQPDFTEGPDGSILELEPGDVTLVYKIINEGWQNENYFYTMTDDLGWFSDLGTAEINPGEEVELFISGNVPNEGTTNTLMFTVFPENAMQLVKVVSLNLVVHDPNAEITLSISYYNDWNLVGLPLSLTNTNYQFVFPESVPGSCLGYDGEYTQAEDLEMGNGYWLRFSEAGTTDITGISMNDLDVEISEGWNIISGISNIVDVYEGIYDSAEILITETFYGFDGNYVSSSFLVPGKGYWVRAQDDGMITISSQGGNRQRKFSEMLTDVNILRVNRIELFFGTLIVEEEQLKYSLPPKPPASSTDIRFFGDTKLCVENECLIEVMTNGEPITLEYEVEYGEHWELVPIIADGMEKSEAMSITSNGQITLSPHTDQLILRKNPHSDILSEFAIHPIYPNPFNPVTTIQFTLPMVETWHAVSLQVYDITGKLVATLMDEQLGTGQHTVKWNGTRFSSGVYFLKLEAGSFSQVEKLMLIK